MSKILTWNLQHGGGNRIDRIVDVLKQHQNPSTLVLTEFRNNNNGAKIQSVLIDLGFINQFKTDADMSKNSLLIATKEDYNFLTFPELNEHSHRVIKVFNSELSIYGCYFPQSEFKKPVFEFLLNEIKNHPNENMIITGDINTGKHYIDEKGATFIHSAYLNQIEGNNFFDAWRHFHKEKKEFSWYSSAGNGFRLDHFFANNNLKHAIKGCNYIHNYREEGISDHSMMMLEMDA